MLAVLLAGGFGTRLRPLTFTTPKPLLPVANKPLIEHCIAGLPREVDEVAVAVGYKADMLEDHFRHHPISGKRVHIVVEDHPLGTGGAIRNAVEEMDGPAGTVVVRNADLVDTLPVERMLDLHRREHALATISLWEVEDPSPFGVAKMDGTRIASFVEKPRREDAPSKLVNAGTYLLEPDVFEHFPEQGEGELSIERTVFPELCATRRGMRGLQFTGHWVDCGRPDSYLDAHRQLLKNGIALGAGARCQAKTIGFASFGPDAVAEAGATVENSVLLREAHVARDAVLVRSIVGVGARIGQGARLEDAVIGDGAVVAAGAKLKGAKVPEVVA